MSTDMIVGQAAVLNNSTCSVIGFLPLSLHRHVRLCLVTILSVFEFNDMGRKSQIACTPREAFLAFAVDLKTEALNV
jgi:hypothetical protein